MDQTLAFSQSVTSVELFQSPSQGSSGYQILASLPLGGRLIRGCQSPLKPVWAKLRQLHQSRC